jgi:hypothetical protein
LLDSLEADHRAIGPAADRLTEAGRRYAATANDARVALVGARWQPEAADHGPADQRRARQ